MSNQTPWVLTLGDGSLSFSYAFMKKFSLVPIDVAEKSDHTNADVDDKKVDPSSCHLVATTFDSSGELVLKFPEATGLRSALKTNGALVLGSVDATNIIRTLNTSLRKTLSLIPSKESLSPQQGGFSDPQNQHSEDLIHPLPKFFDAIIFNNPHTGEENFVRHQILLRHFFHSSLAVLAPEGQIWVALCEDQPERWKLLEIAACQGLRCVLRTTFNEDIWPGYNHKRHQNNHSFPATYMEHFIFVRNDNSSASGCGDNGESTVNVKAQKRTSTDSPSQSVSLHGYCTAPIDVCFAEAKFQGQLRPIFNVSRLSELAKQYKPLAKAEIMSQIDASKLQTMSSSFIIPSKTPKIDTVSAKAILSNPNLVDLGSESVESEGTGTGAGAGPVLLNKNGKPLTSKELAKMARLRARLAKNQEQREEKERKMEQLQLLLEQEKEGASSADVSTSNPAILRCQYCLEEKPKSGVDEVKNDTHTDIDRPKHAEEMSRKKTDRLFSSQADLEKHIKAKHEKQDVQTTKDTLNTHMKQEQDQNQEQTKDSIVIPNSWRCEVCVMSFSSQEDYENHFSNLQPASFQVVCQDCGKTFTNARAFQQHCLFTSHSTSTSTE